MCTLNYFILLFNIYFVLLIITTVYRKGITNLGFFYIFTIFLLLFFIFLLIILSDVLVFGHTIDFKITITNITWLNLDLNLAFKVDALSYLFMLLVTVIGLSTNIYILNYFKYESNEDIFTLLIQWFIFSMLTLVLANNLFTLFLGWESIGLSSFFLINFWYNRRGTIKSSFKAFIFNKISDVFLFIFIISLTYAAGTTNITLLNLKFLTNSLTYNLHMHFIILTLIICSMFKSAQIFAHLWLPDSMEAPVPASALIHSATLVSAGLYLLIRFSPLITLCGVQHILVLIGSITALYGGLISASQTDMKKLLAYSTISHCGFLFLSIGLEYYITTVIYLFLHGLFKALTFFCAGSFIRVYNSQDTRNMGSGFRTLPMDSIFLIISAINLGGLPFSFGYLYKSLIYLAILNSNIGIFFFGLSFLGLLTGVIYTYRLIFYSIFDISKEFINPVLLELQIKKNKYIDDLSFSSFIQILSCLIMYLFVVYIYLVFKNIFLINNFLFSQVICQINVDTLLGIYSSNYYTLYYEIFYNSYFVCLLVLFLFSWKYSYTINYKYALLIHILYVFFISLFLNCGVIFWQKLQLSKILILVFLPINQKF